MPIVNEKTFFKKKNGFTLIEMSVVIVIIGLLTIGISSGSALVEQAKISMTVVQIKQIERAIRMFTIEYDIVPGGLQNTLKYFPNAIFIQLPQSYIAHACVNSGDKPAIAAEGSGGKTVENHQLERTIVKNDSGLLSDFETGTKVTYTSIAMCQLYLAKYINISYKVNAYNRDSIPGNHIPSLSLYKNAGIIIGSYDNAYYIAMGNVSNISNIKEWTGNINDMKGSIPGNLLKKLNLRFNKKIKSYKVKTIPQGNYFSDYLGSGIETACNYNSKNPNCMALYKIFD